MASVLCLCGNLIRLGGMPVDRGLVIFRQGDLWKETTAIAEDLVLASPGEGVEELEMRLTPHLDWRGPTKFAVQCDNCGRLLVLDLHDEVVGVFRPDESREGELGGVPVYDFFDPDR
jgi:hypothetical protein